LVEQALADHGVRPIERAPVVRWITSHRSRIIDDSDIGQLSITDDLQCGYREVVDHEWSIARISNSCVRIEPSTTDDREIGGTVPYLFGGQMA